MAGSSPATLIIVTAAQADIHNQGHSPGLPEVFIYSRLRGSDESWFVDYRVGTGSSPE